jgi:hypothetical protein
MKKTVDILSHIKDSWKQVLTFLPRQWELKCKELGAIRRKLRKFSGPEAILHTFMIHLLGGCSLRQTAALAQAGQIAHVSDVAILKRLRRAQDWLGWMAQSMIEQHANSAGAPLATMQRDLYVVDATVVSEPGRSAHTWRLHYAFDLSSLRCAQAKLTDQRVGETFKNFDIKKNGVYMGDRGLYQWQGIEHVVAGGADVVVRMSISGPTLYHPDGTRFGVLTHLRSLKADSVGEWPVEMQTRTGQRISGRVCAVRKGNLEAHYARQEVIAQHQRKGKRASKAALEAAKYVFVFTTLGADQLSAAAVVELYRGRWQIELAFKRMKSILGLGHLHAHDPQGAAAWLQGKLLCALLIEKLLDAAEFFSPRYVSAFLQTALAA